MNKECFNGLLVKSSLKMVYVHRHAFTILILFIGDSCSVLEARRSASEVKILAVVQDNKNPTLAYPLSFLTLPSNFTVNTA